MNNVTSFFTKLGAWIKRAGSAIFVAIGFLINMLRSRFKKKDASKNNKKDKSEIKILVMMQLKDKMNMSFLRDKKKTIFAIVYSLISITVITFLAYFVFYITILLGILSLIPGYLPGYFMVFVFTIMQIMSISTVTYGLTKTLYFAEDNKILLTLPAKPNNIFFSKLIVYYITELKKNFFYIVPVFIAYGIVNSFAIYYYLILLFAFIFISLFVVMFAAFISVPTMWIIVFLRRQKYVQMGLFVMILGVITVAVFYLVSLIPANFNLIANMGTFHWEIRGFLELFEKIFVPFAYVTYMIIGVRSNAAMKPNFFPLSNVYTLLSLIGLILFMGTVIWFGIRPFFFKMASKHFEHRGKTQLRPKANRQHNWFASAVKKELLFNFRSPGVFFNNFLFVFILPFAIFLLGQIFASMDTRLTGQHLGVSFSLLIILLILLTNNAPAASLFSSEGAAAYIQKTKPASQTVNIVAKLSLNYILSILSIVFTVVLMTNLASLNALESIYLFITVICVHTAHILWSVDMDMSKPQNNLYKDGIQSTTNPNEVKSVITAFFLAFVFFGALLWLLFENYHIAWLKVAFLAIALLALRIFLNRVRTKVYEIQGE